MPGLLSFGVIRFIISTGDYFLVIVGYCEVEYNGRVRSDGGFMGKGDKSIEHCPSRRHYLL